MTITDKHFAEMPHGTLEQIQQNYEIQFPADYVRFIIDNNGVSFKPNEFNYGKLNRSSIIEVFFGVGDNPNYDHMELRKEIYNTRPDMPADVIPIGDDPGGNYERDNIGKDSRPNHANLFLIADSFTDFLASLH